jgi:thymidylate kinase
MTTNSGLPALLEKFDQMSLSWCSWKNNHELDRALAGESDLDILVDGVRWREVESALSESGFVAFVNLWLSYPYIHHFYGPGEQGAIIHLHIYRRIITGESQTKAYDLPVVDFLLEENTINRGIRIPSLESQKKVFLLRHYIKIGSLISICRTFLDRRDYADEYEILRDVSLSKDDWLGIDFENLDRVYQNRGLFQQLALARKVKRLLMKFRRFSGLGLVLFRQYQLFYRLLNKLVLHHKKRPVSGGLSVAVVGLDGAGKSTSVAYLQQWLCKTFDVRVFHIGRPGSSALGLPFNLALRLFKWGRSLRRGFRNGSGGTEKSNTADAAGNMGLLLALRYLVLAHDRAVLARKANRYRSKGGIVIFDRFPSINFGRMDSPRIPVNSRSGLIRKMAEWECVLYKRIICPDVLIRLDIPVEVAVARNDNRVKAGKETAEEIRDRHRLNSSLSYRAETTYVVDMNRDMSSTTQDLRNIFWAELNSVV